jgi:hypothetical protein
MTFAPAIRSICLAILFFATVHSRNRARAQVNAEPATQAVQIAMRNVTYHYAESITVHIVRLQGALLPTRPGAIVVFDDKNSFTLALASAEISISCNALAQVLNENVLSAADSPIKNLSIESKNNRLIVKGKLHQKGDILFETEGVLMAEPDGRIHLHTEHLKASHLPILNKSFLRPIFREESPPFACKATISSRCSAQLSRRLSPPGKLETTLRSGMAKCNSASSPCTIPTDHDRYGAARSLRLLSRSLPGPTRCRLHEKYAAIWPSCLLPRLQQAAESRVRNQAPQMNEAPNTAHDLRVPLCPLWLRF